MESPRSWRMAATVELSTPPLMATAVVPVATSEAFEDGVEADVGEAICRDELRVGSAAPLQPDYFSAFSAGTRELC